MSAEHVVLLAFMFFMGTVTVCALQALGLACHKSMNTDTQAEAVKRGFARWEPTGRGGARFVWNEPTENTAKQDETNTNR
jgi:hypothetical protein